jgi:diguanylate cyclase (GGDEF)-like protein
MEESLQREILRAAREKSSIGIVMTDIDFFKRFNDRYGHGAGDELLARIGQYLRSSVRGSDVVCRYGGEEFILFLPECSRESAYNHIEQIREGVQRLDVQYQGKRLEGVTLSFGIAVYPEQGTNAETLINAADKALYRAKEEGRNRTVACQ